MNWKFWTWFRKEPPLPCTPLPVHDADKTVRSGGYVVETKTVPPTDSLSSILPSTDKTDIRHNMSRKPPC